MIVFVPAPKITISPVIPLSDNIFLTVLTVRLDLPFAICDNVVLLPICILSRFPS